MSQSRKFPVTFACVFTLLSVMLGGPIALAQSAAKEAPLSGDYVQVNVNEADAAEIADTLVGIGMSRAQAIVQYREEHGRFTSLDDLVDVKGVGEATVNNNKDRIRFE
jgi:competence protein ComEA